MHFVLIHVTLLPMPHPLDEVTIDADIDVMLKVITKTFFHVCIKQYVGGNILTYISNYWVNKYVNKTNNQAFCAIFW